MTEYLYHLKELWAFWEQIYFYLSIAQHVAGGQNIYFWVNEHTWV